MRCGGGGGVLGVPGQAVGHGRERRSGRWQRAMKQGGAVGGQIAAGDAHGCAAARHGGSKECVMKSNGWCCGDSVMRCRGGRGAAAGSPRWVAGGSPRCGAWFQRGTPDSEGDRRAGWRNAERSAVIMWWPEACAIRWRHNGSFCLRHDWRESRSGGCGRQRSARRAAESEEKLHGIEFHHAVAVATGIVLVTKAHRVANWQP